MLSMQRRRRAGVRAGTRRLRIRDGVFSLRAHREFLGEVAGETARFQERRQAAFRAERERWEALPPWREPAPAAAVAPDDGDARLRHDVSPGSDFCRH